MLLPFKTRYRLDKYFVIDRFYSHPVKSGLLAVVTQDESPHSSKFEHPAFETPDSTIQQVLESADRSWG